MHWFIHGGVGVVAANAWPERPLLAIGVSLCSHYLFDWLPHKDLGIAGTTARWRSPEVREFLTTALPDFVFTGSLALIVPWLWPMPFWLTAGCVLASVAPDLIVGLAKLTNAPLLQMHLAFHNCIHYDHDHRPVHWGWNIFIHVVLFAALAVATGYLIHRNGTTIAL